MEYFRRYLVFLRRYENEGLYKMKVSTMALIASLVGIILGFLMDWLLPHGYFTNMFRGTLAVATGLILFSFSYLFAVDKANNKLVTDRYYKTVRERFSHRQRVNFSIAVGVLIASFILLSSADGLLFTLKAILAVFLIFTLIAFSRRNRSEFIKEIHEIPDIRDLETQRNRKMLAKERESKADKKKSKKRK